MNNEAPTIESRTLTIESQARMGDVAIAIYSELNMYDIFSLLDLIAALYGPESGFDQELAAWAARRAAAAEAAGGRPEEGS